MGGGSYLQWAEDSELRSNIQAVVDGISSLRESNGWTMAFNESDIDSDNNPDYCAGWITRGLLDAHRAGIMGAGDLNRAAISMFNNHSKLAWFLPPNGGPHPSLPYPSGFDNVTNGGWGNGPGHMIYIQFQGMIKHSLTALDDEGTQSDIDILESLYLEQWWLQALLNNDTYHSIWHRQFFSSQLRSDCIRSHSRPVCSHRKPHLLSSRPQRVGNAACGLDFSRGQLRSE